MSKKRKSAPQQEAEFLETQTRIAKEALATVLAEMKQNLAHSADVRAWANRYPWPTVATAAVAGAGAGVAVKSVISSGKHTNGAAGSPNDRISELHIEVKPKKKAEKKQGTIAGGVTWLLTGLATAAGEALFAATRKNVEATLRQSQNGHADRPPVPAT